MVVAERARVAAQVQAPAWNFPSDEQFFSAIDPTKPDIVFLKNHFYREGRVTEEQAIYILEKATELLRAEPNVLDVDAPITSACGPRPRVRCAHESAVCGDIHGQYVRRPSGLACLSIC